MVLRSLSSSRDKLLLADRLGKVKENGSDPPPPPHEKIKKIETNIKK
tara:strand:+ start:256 stop:396 length:141 start_codon:yes stop_codon:yes gene_type:complete